MARRQNAADMPLDVAGAVIGHPYEPISDKNQRSSNSSPFAGFVEDGAVFVVQSLRQTPELTACQTM